MKKHLPLISKILLSFLILTTFSFISYAQNRTLLKGEDAKQIDKDFASVLLDEYEIVHFIEFNKNVKFNSSMNLASKLGLSNQHQFKIDNQFQSLKDKSTVIRLQQMYNGLVVMGGNYVVQDRIGYATTANGNYFKIDNLSKNATLTENRALEIALSEVKAQSYMWENEANESYIKKEMKDENATFYPGGQLVYTSKDYNAKNAFRLAYQFEIYANNPVSRYRIEVDAENGTILNKYNLLHTQSVEGRGISLYNGEVDIDILQSGNNYILNDNERGQGIYTYDMQNGINYGNAIDFSESDDFFDQENNQTGVSAHFGAAATYDYFLNNFGLNSFDGNGAAINSYVHFDYNYVNAFWDGYRMTYGDGDQQSTTALVSIDIVGHEIAHAVTQYSANLIYQYESGALNESFSDIFGQSIEFEAAPETASWNLADEIFTNGSDMIRSISDPKSQGNPDTYLGEYWEFSGFDNGGVHINSGVQNYWFYLLVEGGSGVNDNGVEYTVSPIGIEKAQQIAFRNLFFYLNPSSQYTDARFGSERAAEDLFGEDSQELLAVKAAWNAVGVPSMDPEIVVADTIDFGKILIGEKTLTIPITNNGLSVLTINELAIDDPEFTLPSTPLDIQDGEPFYLEITYNATTLGVKNAVLSISNNDTDKDINIAIEVVAPPSYSFTPENFTMELLAGESRSEEITIQNNNDYDLVFESETEQIGNTSPAYIPTGEQLQVGKSEMPAYKKAAGSPNILVDSVTGGYSWTDNVVYDWFDIKGLGNSVYLTDDSNSGQIYMRLNFPFFNEQFSYVSIASNGWISFSNQSSMKWNLPLPNTSAPENVVAIMANDLHPNNGSCDYYYDQANGRFIIQFTQWSLFENRDARFDMQIHLYETGNIKVLYDKIEGAIASTVGIQNRGADLGLTVAYDNPEFFKDGYAVEMGKGQLFENWLSVEQDSLVVPANGSASFNANINTVGLFGGEYRSNVLLKLQEFEAEHSTVPVNLTIIGAPNLEDQTLDLGQFFSNQTIVKEFYIRNVGNEELTISDAILETESDEISFELSSMVIAPYDSALLTVEGLFGQAIEISNALLITSNDAENEITSLPIVGVVLDPPVINIDQTSLSTALLSGETDEKSLVIDNLQGSSDLIVEVLTRNFDYQNNQAKPIFNDFQINDEHADAYANLNIPENTELKKEVVARSTSSNNGRLFTMNSGESVIYELDIQTGSIVNTINTNFLSYGNDGLAYDGQHLYYNYGSFSRYIYKVDANTGDLIDSVLINNNINIDGLAHSGSTLLASSYNQGAIYSVNFENDQVELVYQNQSIAGGFSFGGSRNSIFVTNSYQNTITEIDFVTSEVVQTHSMDFPTYGLAYSNALGKIFASNQYNGGIVLIDPEDWSYETFASGFYSYAMAADESYGTNWLSTDFQNDTIPAGTSKTLNVVFNAEDLLGGVYTADLIINSNDPDSGSITVPVSMEVTGVPEITVETGDIVFPNTLIGGTKTKILNILNSGTDDLSISLAVEGGEYSVQESELLINPKSALNLEIFFQPNTVGEKSGLLTLTTNDVNNSSLDINLSGLAVDVPAVSYNPTEINLDLSAGQEVTEIIEISNLVDYDLDLLFETTQSSGNQQQYELVAGETIATGKLELPKYQKAEGKQLRVNQDDEITGGYDYIDTNSGLAYNWFDIQSQGTEVYLSDDSNSGPLNLGFDIEFFEDTYSTINIGSNGWLSFTYSGGDIWSEPLPSQYAPPNVIALLANDLLPGQGACHYFYDASRNRFIVQYTDWTYYGSSSQRYFTMQAQIYANGDIIILYDNISTAANGTVGIQNNDGTKGLTVAYFEPERIVSGYGVKISKGASWLSLASNSLALSAQSTSDFPVKINTEGLLEGSYTADILVSESEFGTELTSIPVTINVTGASVFSLEIEEINFEKVIINNTKFIDFEISNPGNDVLTFEMNVENERFSLTENSFTIAPFESDTARIIFEPNELGNINTELVFTTNDPEKPEITVDLSGRGVNAPMVSFSTNEIIMVLEEGQEATEVFNISNAENSADLNYNIKIELEESEEARRKTSSVPLGFYASENQNQEIHGNLTELNPGVSTFTLTNNSGIILDTLRNIPQYTTGAVNIEGKIYSINVFEGSLIVYNPDTETIEDSVPIHNYPFGITFDGSTLWIGQDGSSIVFGYDLNGNLVGSFDLPFYGSPALAFDGEHIIVAEAFVFIYEVFVLNIDGSLVNTYSFEGSSNIYLTQLFYSNDNLWVMNIANQGNVLERYTLNSDQLTYSEENLTGINNNIYSLTQYNNELVVFPFEGDGYILEDGVSRWLTLNSYAGVVEENESSNTQMIFNSTGLQNGTYRAKVLFSTNDPSNPDYEVQAILSIGNNPPMLIQGMEDITMFMDETMFHEMDLNEYFSDDKTEHLEFEVNSITNGIVSVNLTENILRIDPLSLGETEIKVSAFDGDLHGRTSFIVTVEEVLGTNKVNQNLQLFPNPTEGILQVETKESLEFLIFDIQGRKLPFSVIKSDMGYRLDLTTFNAGLYLIKAKNDKEETFSAKFIKK